MRVLSAGCASGDEAYSIVIALQRAGLERAGLPWQIDACDLNPECIALGERGLVRGGLAAGLR